jgi:transcriptional regulator with XRE-family HTH domain
MSTDSFVKDSIFLKRKMSKRRKMQGLEKIRKSGKDGVITAYRFARMIGVSDSSYGKMLKGTIKTPSGKVIIAALLVAILYTDLTFEEIVRIFCQDFGVSEEAIKEAYAENKKHKGMAKR